MARYYVAGGTGQWNSTSNWATASGGSSGAAVPTSTDDVFLDGNSGTGTLTITSGAVCQSLNATGFTGTLSHPAAITLTIGSSAAGASNVSLLLVSGMTYTLGNASTSALIFASTYTTTAQTIATGGQTLGNLTFSSAGSWSLSSAVTASTITHTAGTLNTNGQTCTWVAYSNTGTTTRALSLGASTINLSMAGVAFSIASATGMTLTAGTSTLNFTGAGSSISGPVLALNSINATGSGVFTVTAASSTGFSYVNLTRTSTTAKTDSISFTANTTISGTLTLTGNSTTSRLQCVSSVIGTARTLTAASVSITNVDFEDITGAGAASPFTGSSIGDCQGNSGITVTTAVTRYRVGSGGNWSDTNWSTSSGGTSGATNPLPQDTVYVDTNASGTIVVDMPRMGGNIITTGFAGVLSMSSVNTNVYGNWNASSSTYTFSGSDSITFQGRGTQTFTSGGRAYTSLTFSTFGGTYTFQDNLNTGNGLSFLSGTLNANGFNVSVNNFTATGSTARTLNMGSGTWSLGATGTPWNVSASGFTLNASTSTITLLNATITTSKTFAGAGLTYNNLTITEPSTPAGSTTGQFIITGANTFNVLTFSGKEKTVQFPASTTQTMTQLFAKGDPGNTIYFTSSSPGTAYTLSQASGTVSGEYLSIQDSTATGGATFNAGASKNVSNNTGWNFTGDIDDPSTLSSFI